MEFTAEADVTDRNTRAGAAQASRLIVHRLWCMMFLRVNDASSIRVPPACLDGLLTGLAGQGTGVDRDNVVHGACCRLLGRTIDAIEDVHTSRAHSLIIGMGLNAGA